MLLFIALVAAVQSGHYCPLIIATFALIRRINFTYREDTYRLAVVVIPVQVVNRLLKTSRVQDVNF